MTQKQVQDALISHLSTQLSSYANLLVTYSGEAAMNHYKKAATTQAARHTVLVVPGDGDRIDHPQEDRWTFFLDATTGLQEFAQATPVAAQDADRAFVASMREAINGNSGFAALTAAGLEQPRVENMKEDQRGISVGMVNPHVFQCSTF